LTVKSEKGPKRRTSCQAVRGLWKGRMGVVGVLSMFGKKEEDRKKGPRKKGIQCEKKTSNLKTSTPRKV